MNTALRNDLEPEGFLWYVDFGRAMARFPQAERRRLHQTICMQGLLLPGEV